LFPLLIKQYGFDVNTDALLFLELNALLKQYQWLWRHEPFKHKQTSWKEQAPTLHQALLALTEDELESLQDPNRLQLWGCNYLPELGKLSAVIDTLQAASSRPIPKLDDTDLSCVNHTPNKTLDERLRRDIPGRKQGQIESFSALAIQHNTQDHWVDWCAGKGHLARNLNIHSQNPVLCLEFDHALCEQGEKLAARDLSDVRFLCHDVLTPVKHPHKHPYHTSHHTALHACGDLHVSLIEQATLYQWQQLSIAPCCYQRINTEYYRPLSTPAKISQLSLSKAELALSVQETATASPRITRQRIKMNQYRLGFDELQRELHKKEQYLNTPSLSPTWLEQGFDVFCQELAKRKKLTIPDSLNLEPFLLAGNRRYEHVRRLELARQLFRRPLELWLILDRVLFLQEAGYNTQWSVFCERHLSPRNVIIQAQKK
jgi:hypothetical protein